MRRFRTAYVEVARKNGKSVMLAGTAVYALIADGEPGSHVYAAATTRDQAKIVFGEAERIVDASPALRARVTRTVNNLAVLATSSWFRPLSAWCASNVTVRRDPAGNEKPNKERSTEKIDAIVAAIMAVGRMQAGGQGERSVYEDRDLLVIKF